MSTDIMDKDKPSNGSAAKTENEGHADLTKVVSPETKSMLESSSELPCHPAQEEADQALDQANLDGFGKVSTNVTPFSRQIKLECRISFPDDTAAYDAADQNQSRAEKLYFILRMTTLMAFTLYIVCTFFILRYFIENNNVSTLITKVSSISLPAFRNSETVYLSLLVILSSLAFTLLRFSLRWFFHDRLLNCTARFAHEVSMRYSDIEERMRRCAGDIFIRSEKWEKNGLSWEESVKLWTRAALWNAKRAEYLDRYSTTVSWKIRLFIKRLEGTTFILKALILGVAFYSLYQSYERGYVSPDHYFPLLLSVAIVLITFLIGWGYFFRWDDNFLINAFEKEAKLSYDPDTHYYNFIASRLAAKAVDIEKREFGKQI